MTKEWEVTVSLTAVVVLPFDEDDTPEVVKQYLGRKEGRDDVFNQFRTIRNGFNGYKLNGYPVDIVPEDIDLKELE